MGETRTKDNRLRRQARATAAARGHDMAPFRKLNGRRMWRCACRTCGAYVDVTTWPMPNEIEIGGTAVALHCAKA